MVQRNRQEAEAQAAEAEAGAKDTDFLRLEAFYKMISCTA